MMPDPPSNWNSPPAEEATEPRDWTRMGVLIALQPLSWKIGLDQEGWRQISFDFGPFRLTVAWP